MSDLELVRSIIQGIVNSREGVAGFVGEVYCPGPIRKERADAALAALDGKMLVDREKLQQVHGFAQGAFGFELPKAVSFDVWLTHLQRREGGEDERS